MNKLNSYKNVKNEKNVGFFITIAIDIAVIVIIIVTLFGGKLGGNYGNDKSKGRSKKLEHKEGELIATNEYYNTKLRILEDYLDESVAYSLDYCCEMPCENGESISRIGRLSDTTTAGLVYGYPYASVEELGVKNVEEAKMATQFAIWRLSQARETEEAKSQKYIFDIYIDGNSMGAKVQDCLKGKQTYDECVTELRGFSTKIQKEYVDDRMEKPYLQMLA